MYSTLVLFKRLTKRFLSIIIEDNKVFPLINTTALDLLFHFPNSQNISLTVIRRAPHEFKIACLEDIKALFPSDYNPFYAGFGNRDTDELSYRKIGIPKGKIFIINPKVAVLLYIFNVPQ
ncbi:hypothetical protein B296_00018168 [Ensete ventricosum]|uniref:LNS2/PITP domain-containing protein n=1 Tax=Ensete ventricosum TaxID=4639 RepID=A0A427AKP9_ENSVE|nr:hypothetical protein B296_00018168 [Ensete ventricosum]